MTGLPKFIQLPPFDTYEYSEVMSTNTQTNLFANNLVDIFIDDEGRKLPPNIVCPHCSSANWKRNGKDKATKTIQQYKCTDCGKGFSDLKLSLNSI